MYVIAFSILIELELVELFMGMGCVNTEPEPSAVSSERIAPTQGSVDITPPASLALR